MRKPFDEVLGQGLLRFTQLVVALILLACVYAFAACVYVLG